MEAKYMHKIPRFSTLILAIILGALAGLGVYQAGVKGYLPRLDQNLPKIELPAPQKTQIIIDEESATISVAEKSSPSVVAIGATQKVFNPLDPFSAPRSQDSTIGTGFVVSDKGIIVTNKHVVSDSNARYNVVTKDGKKYEIRKIYRDLLLDLAIVQVDGSDMKALELGDSSKLKIGQSVIAIGNALGRFTNTVTTGVVSGLGRKVVAGDPFSGAAESLDNLIQTDAAINPGNSGGPLLNSAGQVIGVNVATTEGAQNIGFAVPINQVKAIVDEFVQTGTVSRPVLGVRYRFISLDSALLYDVPRGAYIQDVIPGSAAEKAGIRVGEIITKINGQGITEESTVSQVIASKKTGDRITVTLWEDGKEREITVTLQNIEDKI